MALEDERINNARCKVRANIISYRIDQSEKEAGVNRPGVYVLRANISVKRALSSVIHSTRINRPDK